jgi:hypothetical protein
VARLPATRKEASNRVQPQSPRPLLQLPGAPYAACKIEAKQKAEATARKAAPHEAAAGPVAAAAAGGSSQQGPAAHARWVGFYPCFSRAKQQHVWLPRKVMRGAAWQTASTPACGCCLRPLDSALRRRAGASWLADICVQVQWFMAQKEPCVPLLFDEEAQKMVCAAQGARARWVCIV